MSLMSLLLVFVAVIVFVVVFDAVMVVVTPSLMVLLMSTSRGTLVVVCGGPSGVLQLFRTVMET